MLRARLFIIIALTMGMLAVSACPASAIGIFGTWQKSKDMSSGFGFGINQEYSIIPLISAGLSGSYLRYGDKDSWEGINMFPLEATGRIKLAVPYFGVGIGYYLFSGDNKPKNRVGETAFLGAELTILGIGAYAEVRYLFLKPRGDFGRDMSGLGASIGVIIGG